jgi:molybdate transport system substrate-binding protein
MQRILATLFGAAFALVLSAGIATAEEVRVVIVGALQNAVKVLATDFTKETGQQVALTITSPANLTKTLSEGKFDAILAAAPSVDELDKSGGLQSGSRVKLVRVGIGVAVRDGVPKPDLSTPEAFKKTVMAARSIVYSDPTVPNASGALTMRVLSAAGLVDVVKAKGRQEGLVPARELIAKGEVEMGFFNVSEAAAPGCVLAGPVPAPFQQYNEYAAAVMMSPAAKDAAQSFIRYVTAKAAAERWKAAGLEAM